MVTLGDCRTNLLDNVGEIHGIKPTLNKRFTGITVFQIAIMNLLDEGNKQWADFLHSVETALYEVCNICLGIRECIFADLSVY